MAEKHKDRIAVFRALQLGDLLCIIPAVRAVRIAWPEAHITLVSLPWQRPFADRFSHYFDDFLEFPGWPGLPEQKADAERIVEFLSVVRRRHFDLVLQMQGNGMVTNSMCMLWGAAQVAGLRRADDYCPDEKLFPVSEDDEHEVLRFLKLPDALGIPRQGTALEFPIKDGDKENFRVLSKALGLTSQQYICLHPGARDPKRRWSAEDFAHVGDHLTKNGYTVVLTGAESERDLLRQVAGQMQHRPINLIDAVPSLSLGTLAAVIRHSQLLICNDTGVSHIAAALRVPSVVIFSPFSDIRRWAPLNTTLHHVVPVEKAQRANVIQCTTEQLDKARKVLDVSDSLRVR